MNILTCQTMNFLNKEDAQKRFDICKECEDLKMPFYICGNCGCLTKVKCKVESWHCPLGKW